jgi:hypothetical protein
MTTVRWTLFFALMVTLAFAAVAADQDDSTPPEDKSTLRVTTAGQASSTDDSLIRVAEYDTVEDNPVLGLAWTTSPYAEQMFSFDYQRVDSDEQSGKLSWDGKRVFGLDIDFDSMPHRLDHDPLDNLNAVSEIKVTRSTDFEPGADYQIRHKLYDARMTYRLPTVPWLSLRAGYREEQRDGTRQLLSAGHCTSCHVTAQGRDVDQSTSDITLGAHVRAGVWDFDYEILDRDFEDDADLTTMFYEAAHHPGNQPDPPTTPTLPFNDRVLYQNSDQTVLQIPDVEKLAHRLKLRGSFSGGNVFSMTVVDSNTENDTSELEYDFLGVRASFLWQVERNLRLNFFARHDDIDNDEYLVDLLAMNGLTSAPTSPYPGLGDRTFQGWRADVDDPADPFVTPNFELYTRESALDRKDDRLGLDVYWRARPNTSFRFGYEHRNLDRDNVVLADGDGETTTQSVKASWNQRITRRLRWNNSLLYEDVDNPYMNVDGACRSFYEDPNNPGFPPDYLAGSPKSPDSIQYYQLHQLRSADVSNQPSETLGFRSQTTWSPGGNWSVSANFRYRALENDELDTSTWDRDVYGFGAHLWVAANPKLHYVLGYDVQREETDAVYCVPLMDG